MTPLTFSHLLCSHRQPVAAGVQREGSISPAVPSAPASATQHGGQVGVHEATTESAGLFDREQCLH